MTVYVSEYGATNLGVFSECVPAMEAVESVADRKTGGKLKWRAGSDGEFTVWIGSQSDDFDIGFVTQCMVVGLP